MTGLTYDLYIMSVYKSGYVTALTTFVGINDCCEEYFFCAPPSEALQIPPRHADERY
jgi:hypothetical protein